MPARTERDQPILSASFRETSSRAPGTLELFAGDVLDLGSLGESADALLDALAGCSASSPLATLRYFDTPGEAWAFEDLMKFRVLLRPRAMQLCGGDTSTGMACMKPPLPVAGTGNSAAMTLSRMLAGVNRQCRLLVIDPLMQFIPETAVETALGQLQQHALTASRVVVFRCWQNPATRGSTG